MTFESLHSRLAMVNSITCYIFVVTNLIAQLRLGILALSIENGRYTPLHERICFWCKQKIEDITSFYL